MKIDIDQTGSIESNYQGFEEHEPVSLNPDPEYADKIEQIEECSICGKDIDECRCFSPCCGAEIICHDICSECGEHCI